ncbi:MAG: hypothetical protein ACREQA_12975 [Candidatus Binatia bacterium]
MNHFENTLDIQPEWNEQLRSWARPAVIASVTVVILLMITVGFSKSAWLLLGAGRGFIPEGYYHIWGFVLTFGTLLGQAVGWAGGSVIVFYVMTLVGFPATWITARLAMSIVYLGLGAFPFSVYHILYGGWLLGMPRVGLGEWLAANYPDARWLLITAHPIVDLSIIPLGLVFLVLLWKYGERVQRDPAFQTALALSLLGTSLAVALSLAIHSTLVHVRISA